MRKRVGEKEDRRVIKSEISGEDQISSMSLSFLCSHL